MTRDELMTAIGTTGIVAPEDQGQMIEVGYARCDGGVLRITCDRSEPVDSANHARVEYAADDDLTGSYEPQTEAPQAESWQAVDARRAARLMHDAD